jgi:hypothetical protein
MCDDTQHSEEASTVGAKHVEPSATEILVPGAKVGQFFKLNLTKPYILQRLTARTYFFAGGFYTATFYLGDEGVLVFDPPERQGDNLVQAIAEVTELPLRAIAYSHYHADHDRRGRAARSGGGDGWRGGVRIIASTESAAKMDLMKSGMPAPPRRWPGRRARSSSKASRSGSTASSRSPIATMRRVPPGAGTGCAPAGSRQRRSARSGGSPSENHAYYRSNVNQLGALDWTHLVGGHGNVGSKDDIRFYTRSSTISRRQWRRGWLAQFAQGET